MPNRAHVASIDALEAFRNALIIYIEKARLVLDEVSSDVLHTRLWLQEQQLPHWKRQVSLRTRALDQARQEYFAARFSNAPVAATAKAAVAKARAALDEAETRLDAVRRWVQLYDSRAAALSKKPETLRTMLECEAPKAVAYLAQAVATLQAYAEVEPARPAAPAIPLGDTDAQSPPAPPEPSAAPAPSAPDRT